MEKKTFLEQILYWCQQIGMSLEKIVLYQAHIYHLEGGNNSFIGLKW